MSLKLSFGALLVAALLALPAKAAIIINEVDSDSANTPTTDYAEFIELYSDSGGVTPLDGLVIVLFNGNGNVTYTASLDLDGQSTNSNGYYVIGTTSIPGANNTSLLGAGNILQNGVDAVALFQGNAVAAGTTLAAAMSAGTLLDAVVYKTGADVDGVGLASTLLLGGAEVDEFSRDGTATAGAADSIGRFPNASGAARNTTTWTWLVPTPGGPNSQVPEPTAALLLVLAGSSVTLLRRRSAR